MRNVFSIRLGESSTQNLLKIWCKKLKYSQSQSHFRYQYAGWRLGQTMTSHQALGALWSTWDDFSKTGLRIPCFLITLKHCQMQRIACFIKLMCRAINKDVLETIWSQEGLVKADFCALNSNLKQAKNRQICKFQLIQQLFSAFFVDFIFLYRRKSISASFNQNITILADFFFGILKAIFALLRQKSAYTTKNTQAVTHESVT